MRADTWSYLLLLNGARNRADVQKLFMEMNEVYTDI